MKHEISQHETLLNKRRSLYRGLLPEQFRFIYLGLENLIIAGMLLYTCGLLYRWQPFHNFLTANHAQELWLKIMVIVGGFMLFKFILDMLKITTRVSNAEYRQPSQFLYILLVALVVSLVMLISAALGLYFIWDQPLFINGHFIFPDLFYIFDLAS